MQHPGPRRRPALERRNLFDGELLRSFGHRRCQLQWNPVVVGTARIPCEQWLDPDVADRRRRSALRLAGLLLRGRGVSLLEATLAAATQFVVVVTACAPQAVAALAIVLSGGEGRAVNCAAALPTPSLLRRFRVESTPRHAHMCVAVATARASPRKAVFAAASWATAAADASP